MIEAADLGGYVTRVMDEQRALNRATLAVMVSRGAVEAAQHVLEATFWTETEAQADEIADHLTREHGYTVQMRLVPQTEDGGEPELRLVVARTTPLPLESAALDDWTDEMVWAGWKHGSAEFDGWTAVIR